MRAHQEHRVGALQPGGDRLPVGGGRYAGIGCPVAPGRSGEHDPRGRRQLPDRTHEQLAGGVAPGRRGAAQQHVVARIAGDDHARGRESEGADDPGRDEARGDREETDALAREAVRARDDGTHQAVIRQERDAQRGG